MGTDMYLRRRCPVPAAAPLQIDSESEWRRALSRRPIGPFFPLITLITLTPAAYVLIGRIASQIIQRLDLNVGSGAIPAISRLVKTPPR